MASRLALSLDPQVIGEALSTSVEREWDDYAMLMHFMAAAAPQHAQKIVESINFIALDTATEGHWQSFSFGFVRLLEALSLRPNSEPVRSWIGRHQDELGGLFPALAIAAPDAVVFRLRTGLPFNLDIEHGCRWEQGSKAPIPSPKFRDWGKRVFRHFQSCNKYQ